MKTALLPQLQIFLVVARLRSFSGAARELGVLPTDAGRALLESAGPALAQR